MRKGGFSETKWSLMFTGNKKEGAKNNPGMPSFGDKREHDQVRE